MKLTRHCGMAAIVVFAAACGSTASQSKRPAAPATSPRTPSAHDMSSMTGHDAKTMKPAVIPKALAVRADGTFDPAKISLAGIDGVTPAEQSSAEALLRKTVKILPRWSDTAVAAHDGFHAIGDALTGDEHWIHWDWINDTTILDPNKPEALVYHVDEATQKRTLEAVMFLLPDRYTFDNLPDVGGKLVQFHIHNNLCFTNTVPAPQVAGLTDGQGKCPAPLVKFRNNVMMHVWIRPNPCGPFAALENVGAGQIKPGDTRACDTMHGSSL